MLHNVPTLEQFMRLLQQVPYLASKNIYRVATHFLHMDNKRAEHFCSTLLQLKKRVEYCPICFFWREKGQNCAVCTGKQRDCSIICVVETWQVVLAIERAGGYMGVYHVLTGVVSPLEGIGPDQLTIKQLVVRAKNDAKEIILALSQTPEGEATASYITVQLQGLDLKISCLARGIPVGSPIESMDRLTVYKALSERRPL